MMTFNAEQSAAIEALCTAIVHIAQRDKYVASGIANLVAVGVQLDDIGIALRVHQIDKPDPFANEEDFDKEFLRSFGIAQDLEGI